MRGLQSKSSKTWPQIRWMIRPDLAGVMDIERDMSHPWTEEQLLETLRLRNCIGMVAELNDTIIGVMAYELLKGELRVLRFSVRTDFQRRAVGREMMSKLIEKLSTQRRQIISTEVRESNFEGQLFLKAGFMATDIWRGHFEDPDEDAYRFEYQMKQCDDRGTK